MRAGLIPSRALQERRIIHERTQADNENGNGELKKGYITVFYCLAGFGGMVLCRKRVLPLKYLQ